MGKITKDQLKELSKKAKKLAFEWRETVSLANIHGDPRVLKRFIIFFRSNNLSWNKIQLTEEKEKMIHARDFFLGQGIFIEFQMTNKSFKDISVMAHTKIPISERD